jgi:hypothetical protein
MAEVNTHPAHAEHSSLSPLQLDDPSYVPEINRSVQSLFGADTVGANAALPLSVSALAGAASFVPRVYAALCQETMEEPYDHQLGLLLQLYSFGAAMVELPQQSRAESPLSVGLSRWRGGLVEPKWAVMRPDRQIPHFTS